jgi:hypothetical protein
VGCGLEVTEWDVERALSDPVTVETFRRFRQWGGGAIPGFRRALQYENRDLKSRTLRLIRLLGVTGCFDKDLHRNRLIDSIQQQWRRFPTSQPYRIDDHPLACIAAVKGSRADHVLDAARSGQLKLRAGTGEWDLSAEAEFALAQPSLHLSEIMRSLPF